MDLLQESSGHQTIFGIAGILPLFAGIVCCIVFFIWQEILKRKKHHRAVAAAKAAAMDMENAMVRPDPEEDAVTEWVFVQSSSASGMPNQESSASGSEPPLHL